MKKQPMVNLRSNMCFTGVQLRWLLDEVFISKEVFLLQYCSDEEFLV